MDVFDAVTQRRSIRAYKPDPVPEDKLNHVLEAARLAPSAKNRQPWKFIVVKDPTIRQALVPACKEQQFVGEAPVVIVGVAETTDYVLTCGIPAHIIDIAIAMTQITLQAMEEGLGTCWIGAFYQDEVKKILGIPPDKQVVELMTLGYPAESPAPRSRKSFEEVFVFDRYS
ncbi:nitroreductase [candidate division bacterium WOR-3 4484_18]|uniref:Nitroreductase n=1 Tax=candidate division WOR-3 bacterium 4484_18 TaxID=2020626 RepID=A0A257LU00_UNCW3|nr:MAG: nitroreductase [candidate division bacterium WOR-3 4484_18]